MSLVEAEGHAHQKSTRTYSFPNSLFHTITTLVLNTSDIDLIKCFSAGYIQYADVRYHWLKNIG